MSVLTCQNYYTTNEISKENKKLKKTIEYLKEEKQEYIDTIGDDFNEIINYCCPTDALHLGGCYGCDFCSKYEEKLYLDDYDFIFKGKYCFKKDTLLRNNGIRDEIDKLRKENEEFKAIIKATKKANGYSVSDTESESDDE